MGAESAGSAHPSMRKVRQELRENFEGLLNVER